MNAIYNMHNHTPFSDGAYTIDEICEAHLAMEALPIAGVGVCDHLFRTPSSREVKSERDFHKLFAAETRAYVDHVLEARKRWEGKLDIFCGCEINWPLNKDHLDTIRGMLRGVDYVLVEYIDWAGLTQLANQSRRWPCAVGLAHTPVARAFPNTSMDQVVRTMANARIFYEINSKLFPLDDQEPWFHVLPQHRVFVTIGTDTHDDLSCIQNMKPLHDFVAEHGLAEKLLLPRIRSQEPAPAKV